MKLHDNSISHIAKIVQMAILTGTDIVDNLRSVEFDIDNDYLKVNEEYERSFELNINKMVEDFMRLSQTSNEQ
jgi:hypothetical protein